MGIFLFVAPGIVELVPIKEEVRQSDGKVQVKVTRATRTIRTCSVPWKIITKTNDSVYTNLNGKILLFFC